MRPSDLNPIVSWHEELRRKREEKRKTQPDLFDFED